MAETHITQPELPNFVTILAHRIGPGPVSEWLIRLEPVIFSCLIISALILLAFVSGRRLSTKSPGRSQYIAELVAGGFDDFICGVLGPSGRRFTPFIGTLFIYILFMNVSGIIPMLKSSTSSWSTTLALALCVFFYLQYTAIRALGIGGYIYHLLGRPKGVIAMSVLIPALMLFIEIITQFVRPLSLSLRLRSNIWGDDMLLAVLSGFGLTGVPLLIFNMLLAILASIVQAAVFCLLTIIYFALALEGAEEGHGHASADNTVKT
jgi:F-type H+-transporting ATPase subunit a